jgi:NAD(P)-dependent dehydrogenase (short-subunit alcohol dehydrogenase family)
MPKVLVTGAGRGLGLEFARQYAEAGWDVIGTVRQEGAEVPEGVRIELLDMRDHRAVATFHERLAGEPLDLLIANAGITKPGALRTAEEVEGWMEVMAVNVVAPTLLAQCLLPNVVAGRGKMIAISSQMGSIADNGSGGWGAYRTSKAALNAAWRTMAVDMAGEPISIAMLHPGWVKTDMGGGGAPLEPRDSIAGMRRVIEGLTPANTGAFLDYRGETLPW